MNICAPHSYGKTNKKMFLLKTNPYIQNIDKQL